MERTGLALIAISSLTLAGPAAAQDPRKEPPPGVSSIEQYIENIPTSRGSRATGAGNGKGQSLSPQARRRLDEEGGADAAALERLATSPGYGAPERPLRRTGKPAEGLGDDPSLGGALSAAVSAPGEGGEWRLGVLAGILVATTGGLGVVAYRRRGLGPPRAPESPER
jgi:hypothetical protein